MYFARGKEFSIFESLQTVVRRIHVSDTVLDRIETFSRSLGKKSFKPDLLVQNTQGKMNCILYTSL